MAGKDLQFTVTVLSIRPATEDELAAGQLNLAVLTAVLMAARTAAAVNPIKTIPGCSPMESNPVF